MRARGWTRAAAVTLIAAVAVAAGASAATAKGGEVGGQGNLYFLNDSWSGTANRQLAYGDNGDRVYTGDWDGNGTDTLAVRRSHTYYFTNSAWLRTAGPATSS